MNYRFLLFVGLIVGCRKEEPFKPKDYCPTCISSITVNGLSWHSKPYYAFFDIDEQIDTFFEIEIDETNPIHDSFNDALLLYRIPFEQGEFKLNDTIHSVWKTDVSFHVFEVEYGTAAQIYWPVYDGSSEINVENINKLTGEYSLNFNFILFPGGSPAIESHNSSYPGMIQFIGSVQGVITYH